MAIKTGMTITIDSERTGRSYEVLRFTEFDVPIDLETDSDAFDLVFKNPNGVYTGLFSKFDKCTLKVSGKKVLVGNLDSVEYIWNSQDDYIQISGRDLCWKLVDNDALPDTLANVRPKSYIAKKCDAYNIDHSCADNSDIYDKLVIGCGESEISIMNNILLESKHRIWYLVDKIYTGEWATDADKSYVFTRGVAVSNCIPITRLSLKENGTDMRSEVRIYGSNDDGSQKMVGRSTNPWMVDKGIIKRQVRRSYSDSASSKYTSVALKDIRDNFRNNIILTIGVRFDGKVVFMPNKTAQVIDDITGINSIFFIKKVQYTKLMSTGSEAIITMIPADTAFEKIWKSSSGNSVTNLNKLSKEVR